MIIIDDNIQVKNQYK